MGDFNQKRSKKRENEKNSKYGKDDFFSLSTTKNHGLFEQTHVLVFAPKNWISIRDFPQGGAFAGDVDFH